MNKKALLAIFLFSSGIMFVSGAIIKADEIPLSKVILLITIGLAELGIAAWLKKNANKK